MPVDSQPDSADPIAQLAARNFRWGSCQALLYDPTRTDIFPQPFLYSLYERTRLSGQRHPVPLDLARRRGLGPLPTLFCGMTNLGPDAICAYLSQRAVCVVGEWRRDPQIPYMDEAELFIAAGSGTVVNAPAADSAPDTDSSPERFHPLGYCFPSTQPTVSPRSLTGQPSNSVFAGYILFSDCWGKPQQTVLMYLGLAWLFHTFSLAAMHGSRYPTNHLTARWTRKFGFRDCGLLPHSMTAGDDPAGPLVPAVLSTLLREDLEARLRAILSQITPASDPPPTLPSPSSLPSLPG